MCRTHAGRYRDGRRLCGPCWLKADEAPAAIATEQAAEADSQRSPERQARHQHVRSDPAEKEKAAEADSQRALERQAWRQRVLSDLAGAEPIERLLRVVGRFCACRYGNPRRTNVDEAAINELLGSPAWTVAQVTEWFCRRATGSLSEIETFQKTLFGREKCSKIAAWTFREASTMERSVYDSTIFDSIALAKDGHVFVRTEHSTAYWSPLEAWQGGKNLNFSYYGLLLVFEASGLQPVESPPGQI